MTDLEPTSIPRGLPAQGEPRELCYADWKRRFDAVWSGNIEDEFYSPGWERQWDHLWDEYDHLEKFRIERGLGKQTWQSKVEEARKEGEKWRDRKSTLSLTAYDLSQAPLGIVLQRFLGMDTQKGGNHAAVTLESWHRFGEVFAENSAFRCSLSMSQRISWMILTQWWLGSYQDQDLSNAATMSMKAAASSAAPGTVYFTEWYPNAEAFTQVRKSVYNAIMFKLFNCEFNPYQWVHRFRELYLTSLRAVRIRGAQHATAQRLAYASYVHMKGLDVPSIGPYMSSIDKPFPWFRRDSDNQEMPFFLWDVLHRKTVMVDSLEGKPGYCCVSHTWGRWRKEDVAIPGVPWLVPRNERFDIERLPEHLMQMRPQHQYVWIDLFCIPQDGSAKADEEINRQALIFQNAAHCIAWMNDVRDWESTRKALDWLSLSYLHATTSVGIYETDDLLHSLREQANHSSELFTSRFVVHDIEGQLPADLENKFGRRTVIALNHDTLAEPSSWFSSLWTLQEAMLCPDITFVTRDWVPLEDRSGNPVPLDAFFSFLNTVDEVWSSEAPYETYTAGPITRFSKYSTSQGSRISVNKWPDGPRQLSDLALVTRMDNLLENPTGVGLLLVANTRQCTGNRAPAIMSALGITDWFNFYQEAQTNLVLNCYPLAFVQEAAAKLGATFYTSATRAPEIPRWYDMFNDTHKGSMMPFSRDSGWFSGAIGTPTHHIYTPDDHPAVKEWKIKQDGSVAIKQAGILVSNDNPRAFRHSMDIHSMRKGVPNRFLCQFSDWIEDLPKGMCVFAVSLLRDSGRQIGLILQGNTKRLFFTQRLVKVGTFMTEQIELPPTTNVDWLVW